MNSEKIKKIIQQSIDLHVHIGPEVIPRKFNLAELVRYERGKIKGVGVKNHFFPTLAMDANGKKGNVNPFVIYSVVLNKYLGGFNSSVIRASAELSERPIIVWFPTLHSENFLRNQKFEIPKEWIDPCVKHKIKLREAKNIASLSVLDAKNNIKQEVFDVLKTIKEKGAILATGHLSWRESYELVKFAIQEIRIKKIIITHPIYQKIDMPIGIQKKLSDMGAFIEHCYSMYSIDKISIKKIVKQIKEVGAEGCIISSDVGQVFSPSPSEALFNFISLLKKEGIGEKDIVTMLVKNPANLVKKIEF